MVALHLQATLQMLRQAFPSGISEAEYSPLLYLLYPHPHDIYAVAARGELPREMVRDLQRKLDDSGFHAWAKEE